MEELRVSEHQGPKPSPERWLPYSRRRKSWSCRRFGAGAVNQAVKAIAIARGFVAPNGIDLVCIPAFAEIDL